ncbi:MAG TPA: chromate efflux transporter [Steroidobacteraceae bacterium]|nr:chromate efflux transporter [Steroidobacteraceae bacterium]
MTTGVRGSAGEVFAAFLKLGLSSFGGPIAHLGYFQRELIERRRWLDASRYAQLVALAQLLPGPASSQVGFALGLIRAGWSGALAAFVGFTLPSAFLLYVLAMFVPGLGQPLGHAALHGLKLVAIAVVAQGVVRMARRLTPDAPRALLAAATTALVLVVGSSTSQLVAIALGALLGACFLRSSAPVLAEPFELPYRGRTGVFLLVLVVVLLTIAVLMPASSSPLAATAGAFYRSGALVFGGGHVVLPLLQEAVVAPGLVTTDDFLAGYGGAQAMPGPLFSVAAFMGARLEHGHGGISGALVALLAIFLPGLLLMAGALPLWRKLARHPSAVGAISGINAAVVGLLAAALYVPLWTSAVAVPSDVAIAGAAFLLLLTTRLPVLLVVAGCVGLAMARSALPGQLP